MHKMVAYSLVEYAYTFSGRGIRSTVRYTPDPYYCDKYTACCLAPPAPCSGPGDAGTPRVTSHPRERDSGRPKPPTPPPNQPERSARERERERERERREREREKRSALAARPRRGKKIEEEEVERETEAASWEPT